MLDLLVRQKYAFIAYSVMRKYLLKGGLPLLIETPGFVFNVSTENSDFQDFVSVKFLVKWLIIILY